MTDHERGQVDTSAAEVYDGLFVPALFGRFAEPIIESGAVGPHESVIDLACGTGALTRAAAARTDGRVVGIDVNPGMLAVARSHGGDVEYALGDAADLEFSDGTFDLATCQFGVMFYPDPVAGIAEMARVARRGVVAVWDTIDRSDYPAMQELFRAHLGEEAAASLNAPFAMGRDLEDLVAQAGISEATMTSIEGTGRFSSIEEWITTEVRGWTLGESVNDAELAQLIEAGQEALGEFVTADGCVFKMTALVATWGS